MSGIVFKNISRYIGDGAEFDGFNLEIDSGEFVALVGKNGCGKADLIRMAEGYGGRFKGDVIIDGRRVTAGNRGHRMASLVTDIPIIGTPRIEISHVLRKLGFDKAETARRIAEAAELTGITDCLNRRYSKLDSEQRLRAGLARAYAARAKVALMIDPFAGVESRMAARMRFAIMEFRAATGMTFVMSTNSPFSAFALASRIVVLDSGRMLQQRKSPSGNGRAENHFALGRRFLALI